MAKKQYGLGHTRLTVPGRPDLTNKTAVVMVGDKTLEEALEEGGVSDYSDLTNKPSINGVELSGNKTSSDLGVATSQQGAKADTAYQKPSTGIPQSDLSSDVQSQLNKHFKGWWPDLATLKAAITATAGDYAYIPDASPATTASIYVYDSTASSNNYWSDSGLDADTSNVQTFASSQEVNEVNIVNDLTTGGVDDVLSAEQGRILSKDVIGEKLVVIDSAAGTIPYNWVANRTYQITNNGTQSITIGVRTSPNTSNLNSVNVGVGQTVLFTPTNSGNYLRYGDPPNITIRPYDTILPRLENAESEILENANGLQSVNVKSDDNRCDIDNLVTRSIVADSAGNTPYEFIEGKSYYIQSFGSSEVVLSFADDAGNTVSSIGSFTQNQIGIVTAPSGATRIRYGGSCTITIDPFIASTDRVVEYDNFSDGYLTTNGAIGTTVDITNITSSSGWKYKIIEVLRGDRLTLTATGGSAPKAYCFVTKDYKIFFTGLVNTLNNTTVTSPCDGYCIINSNDAIAATRRTAYSTKEMFDCLHKTILSTTSNGGFLPYHFEKGKKYVLTRLDNTPLQITYSIRVKNDLSSTAYNTQTLYGFGSKYVFVAENDANYIRTGSATTISVEEYDSYSRRVGDIEERLFNYGNLSVAVDFDFDNTFIDPSTELEGVTFDTTIMEQVYDKFDALVAANPSYMTKVDAASSNEGNLSYPIYANLNGSASGDYEATPTYKTYMYKLVDTNAKANHSLKKKKLFIIGGTHGNEIAAPFNLYLFTKNLCDGTIGDYFKLRAAFDVYIIPCLNGYGLYHNIRHNANGVDINRNYPIANWSSATSVTDKGDSAGSEFETQLVMALISKYSPDIAIDHHNYGYQDTQFYTAMSYRRFLKLTYKSLVDCSLAFVKNLPTQFGNKYKLFYNIDQSSPYSVESPQLGTMARWGYELGLPFAATMEIGQTICYSNGNYAGSASLSNSYNADAFKVGEFTLRNQLCRYGGFILGNSY